MSIQSLQNDPKISRQRYTDGVASKIFKDTGVKKLLLLAVGESIQENYNNIVQLWSALNINALNGFDCTIAVDLKLGNIIAGLMSHSSAHPCTWCVAPKNGLSNSNELRAIGNISENYDKWIQNGGTFSTAKKFENCIHRPVFARDDHLGCDSPTRVTSNVRRC